jgi:hypothetical protein
MQTTDLTPDDRLRELTTILAAGILRLSSQKATEFSDSAPESSVPPLAEFPQTCLELPAPTVLTVSRAVNNPRDTEISRSTR